MKLIRKRPEPALSVREAAELARGGKGLLVYVYERRAGLMARKRTNYDQTADEFGFTDGADWHTCTTGFAQFVDRLENDYADGEGEFHYFPSLADFCREALAENWA